MKLWKLDNQTGNALLTKKNSEGAIRDPKILKSILGWETKQNQNLQNQPTWAYCPKWAEGAEVHKGDSTLLYLKFGWNYEFGPSVPYFEAPLAKSKACLMLSFYCRLKFKNKPNKAQMGQRGWAGSYLIFPIPGFVFHIFPAARWPKSVWITSNSVWVLSA